MESRFRFRVWDKKEKRWFTSAYLYSPYSTDSCDQEISVYENGAYWDDENVTDENFVIQQCTGLKDYSGKLIFEGDFLYDSQSKSYIEVIWNSDSLSFVFFCLNMNINWCLSKSQFRQLVWRGNIFEGVKDDTEVSH